MAVLPTGIGPVTGGYQIERSLRFNSADSAYLNRTPSGAGTSATIWTFSWWQKGVALTGSTQVVFGAESGGTRDLIRWDGLGNLEFIKGSSTTVRVPTAKYRDPSAWYHFIINVSGTTVGVYVNGVQVTAFTTSNNPSGSWLIGQANLHRIGLDPTGGDALNGYMTEVNFIDGQALTPSSFGETDSNTGVWKPKAYTGTYGTNGFYLSFKDNTSTTTLGYDDAGSNDWTTNNFSVTAGAGNDSLVDSPTSYGTDTGVGGEVRGNYATLNAVRPSTATLSEGNLKLTATTAAAWANRLSTIGMREGKWYCEFKIDLANSPFFIGIADESTLPTQYIGQSSGSWGYYGSGGTVWNNASSSALGASYTTGDLIGIAFNADSGQLTFYKNGVSQGTVSSIPSGQYFFAFSGTSVSTAGTANFGQRAFAYTAPSGFKALCTQNLPTPTIGATSTTQAGKYFNPVIYTGTGSTRTVTGVGFQPDFLWIKERSEARDHALFDAVRGAGKYLFSNTTDAEDTATSMMSAFTSDGFTVGASSYSNANAQTYVAWNWKANGAGVSNTAGDIASTVSVSQTSGFSIVSFAFPAVATKTVGHGLGVAPQMVIVKSRSSGSEGWVVYHAGIGNTSFVLLNSTNASVATITVWNDTSPTSSVFTLGSGFTSANYGANGIAYCFAPVAGYSAFGSYTGNGAADGPFVFANHRPAFLLVKRTDTTSNWTILDFQREGYNVDNDPLFPNLSNAEGTTDLADLLSNGFKLRSTDASVNASGGTYIYMSLASNPFKYSLAR